MRPATEAEISEWNGLVATNPDGGNVLQSRAFGEVKGSHGWRDRYFMFEDVAVLVLERSVPYFGRLWYVPRGPGVAEVKDLAEFAKAVSRLSVRPFLLKLDPELPSGGKMPKAYRVAARDLQYNVHTILVDLQPEEDAILASFKQKTRYNIRLAAKKGVTAEAVELTQDAIDTMYELYATTTKRANVYLRSKEYFSDFWRLHAEQGIGQMFFAKYEGKVLAGAFVTFIGYKGLYKDGGSLRDHSEVQAPYALQWAVMRWLKEHGVTEYDLHGVPPADRIDDPTHHLAGLARFKTGYNPEVTEYIGTFDLPLDMGKYAQWQRFGERLAVAYEYRMRKRLFY